MDLTNLFVNQIASYFGDEDDETALPRLRKDMADYPEVRRILREGLDHALSDPDFDRKTLVRNFANRRGDTDEQARAWLMKIRDALLTS